MAKLQINLLGTSFTIQANEDQEYLEKLLGYYSRITADVQKIDSIKNPTQVAILSGIMLCDELYKEKQTKVQIENGTYIPDPIIEKNPDEEEIAKRTQSMIEKISKVL